MDGTTLGPLLATRTTSRLVLDTLAITAPRSTTMSKDVLNSIHSSRGLKKRHDSGIGELEEVYSAGGPTTVENQVVLVYLFRYLSHQRRMAPAIYSGHPITAAHNLRKSLSSISGTRLSKLSLSAIHNSRTSAFLPAYRMLRVGVI